MRTTAAFRLALPCAFALAGCGKQPAQDVPVPASTASASAAPPATDTAPEVRAEAPAAAAPSPKAVSERADKGGGGGGLRELENGMGGSPEDPMSGKKPMIVRAAQFNVEGSLARDIVERVVRQNLAAHRSCYAKELVKNPKAAGTINASLVISGEGLVTNASKTAATAPDSLVLCVLGALRRLAFPKPEKNETVTASYVVTFAPE